MNWFEWRAETFAGYPVDWGATGTWAQLGAALLALMIAAKISRAELDAQRTVAREAERQYTDLVVGLARRAAADICTAAQALQDKAMRDLVRGGDGPQVPNVASNVMTLRELDVNRMLSAEMALAVVELRRLSGWGRAYSRQARDSWRNDQGLDPKIEGALDRWARSSRAALRDIEEAASRKDQTPDRRHRARADLPIARKSSAPGYLERLSAWRRTKDG